MKMKNKSFLAISAFITVFVITVGIGVITKVSANNVTVSSSPTVDAAAYALREQAYQEIINQANQQIELANQQIATLAGVAITPSEPISVAYPYSAEQAAAIGQQIAGIAPTATPELVSYNGTAAYEVVFDNGKIYVDANTGSVLYNGLQVQVVNISTQQALYIAMNYLPNSQPVSMYYSTFNGASVYVIDFSDGQSVYVDLVGNVIAVQMASPSQSSGNSENNDQNESSETDGD